MTAKPVAVVIEDDLDFRGLIGAVLDAEGLTVHCEETGTGGISAVFDYRPDIVILDFGLPDMNGADVARNIREFSRAYILALTGWVDIESSMRAAGVSDFMTKPFSVRELRGRVRTALACVSGGMPRFP